MSNYVTRFLIAAFLTANLFLPWPLLPASARSNAVASRAEKASLNEANLALQEGRHRLRLYQADRAFPELQKALKIFTENNDRSGMGAAQDLLGEIYAQTGQDKTAIEYFRKARESFLQANDQENANFTLAKIGERYLLLGEIEQARAAFAGIQALNPKEEMKKSESSDKKGVSFASCLLYFEKKSDPNNPPNQGHAPTTRSGIGRMDLRIRDENGAPVQGVRAQIQSTRPDGKYCEAWDTTGPSGRTLIPPLNIADKIKLVLRRPGQPPQELSLSASDLAKPVQVVMTKAGASVQQTSINPCFQCYRAIIAFSKREFGIGRADFENNRLGESRQRFEELISQLSLPGMDGLKQVTRFRIAAQTALGDIAFKEGRLTDAAKLYGEAAEGARKLKRLELMWAAQRGLGRTYWKQSLASTDSRETTQFRSDSMTAYQAAIRTIETIRAGSLRADEARTTFLATTKDVYDEAAEVIAEMTLFAAGQAAALANEKAVPLTGSTLMLANAGYAAVEQGRARSLLDMLSESWLGITEGVPADLLKRREEIIDKQQEIAQLLMGITEPSRTPLQSVPDLESELERLSAEYDAVENSIRTQSLRYASLAVAQPLTLSEVQQKVLDDGTVMLVYNLGASNSYLWVVSRSGVALARLPARDVINSQATAIRAQLIPTSLRRAIVGIDPPEEDAARGPQRDSTRASSPAEYARAAHALYKSVIEPAAPLIQNKRLLVAPDSALNYVPFEALVTAPPKEGAPYQSLSYLVKSNEVVYAPSASVINLLRQQRRQFRQKSSSVLVIADPVFSSSDRRVRAAVSRMSEDTAESLGSLSLATALRDLSGGGTIATDQLNILRLPGTRAEANEIAKLAASTQNRADVWLDFDASKSRVSSEDLSSYRVIHFATHGLLNSERPKFSGLVLSLIGEANHDGFLRATQIFNFKLGVPFVMLSACETGLGKEMRGEGIIGLARAFMHAGAPTVGVSLWSVSDQSTARLVTDLYKELLSNKRTTPATALRDAQLKMIDNPRYSAPFFWAPFVIVGDWTGG